MSPGLSGTRGRRGTAVPALRFSANTGMRLAAFLIAVAVSPDLIHHDARAQHKHVAMDDFVKSREDRGKSRQRRRRWSWENRAVDDCPEPGEKQRRETEYRARAFRNRVDILALRSSAL